MNPYLLLIVGGLGLVGCLILLFMGMQLLREERAKKEGTPGSEASAGGETPVPVPAPAAPARRSLTAFSDRLGLGARPRGNAHEVLRVLRDNLTGRLVIEIAGRRYGQASDVDDPAVYQGLLTTLRDLHDFAGVEGAHTVDPVQRPAASIPAVPLAVRHPAPPPSRSTTPASAAPATPKPLPPPTMNPFRQMRVLRELAKIPETPTLTIAEQIDEVLQARLLDTPLANRGIRMRPGPRGDAIFELEGQSYAAVEDVPDEEVRTVIRAAIAAWESK
jgi:hypothetical protein